MQIAEYELSLTELLATKSAGQECSLLYPIIGNRQPAIGKASRAEAEAILEGVHEPVDHAAIIACRV